MKGCFTCQASKQAAVLVSHRTFGVCCTGECGEVAYNGSLRFPRLRRLLRVCIVESNRHSIHASSLRHAPSQVALLTYSWARYDETEAFPSHARPRAWDLASIRHILTGQHHLANHRSAPYTERAAGANHAGTCVQPHTLPCAGCATNRLPALRFYRRVTSWPLSVSDGFADSWLGYAQKPLVY